MESAGLLEGEDVRDEDQLISIAQHLSDEHFSIDNFKPSVTPPANLVGHSHVFIIHSMTRF